MKLSWLFRTYGESDLYGHLIPVKTTSVDFKNRSREAVKMSAYFLRQSDPRLPDDADDEGDEIYDEAVD